MNIEVYNIPTTMVKMSKNHIFFKNRICFLFSTIDQMEENNCLLF